MAVLNFKAPNPRRYDSVERIMDEIAQMIHKSGKTYKELGELMKISTSTVAGIAQGRTRWPRPHTFMALMVYFKFSLQIV